MENDMFTDEELAESRELMQADTNFLQRSAEDWEALRGDYGVWLNEDGERIN